MYHKPVNSCVSRFVYDFEEMLHGNLKNHLYRESVDIDGIQREVDLMNHTI